MSYDMSDSDYENLDPEILPVVVDLIDHGFKTWSSCAGHIRFKGDTGGLGHILLTHPKSTHKVNEIIKILLQHNLKLKSMNSHKISLNHIYGRRVDEEVIEFWFSPIGSSRINTDRKRKNSRIKVKRKFTKKSKRK
jgi:hypothetical protein